MSDRPIGILTDADREFLRTDGDYYEGEYARQKRYQRRQAIRKRITQSLIDFYTIKNYLDSKQRKQIFQEPESNGANSEDEFTMALESLLYWLYYGCREQGRDFERLLEETVARAEGDFHRNYQGDMVQVESNLSIETTAAYEPVEEVARRLEEGEALSADTIYQIPSLARFPIDAEQVDVVRVVPSWGSLHAESEREIVETILSSHLGIEAEIEIVGADSESFLDRERENAAIPPEEYERGPPNAIKWRPEKDEDTDEQD